MTFRNFSLNIGRLSFGRPVSLSMLVLRHQAWGLDGVVVAGARLDWLDGVSLLAVDLCRAGMPGDVFCFNVRCQAGLLDGVF